jgi:hypothetical protein
MRFAVASQDWSSLTGLPHYLARRQTVPVLRFASFIVLFVNKGDATHFQTFSRVPKVLSLLFMLGAETVIILKMGK